MQDDSAYAEMLGSESSRDGGRQLHTTDGIDCKQGTHIEEEAFSWDYFLLLRESYHFQNFQHGLSVGLV